MLFCTFQLTPRLTLFLDEIWCARKENGSSFVFEYSWLPTETWLLLKRDCSSSPLILLIFRIAFSLFVCKKNVRDQSVTNLAYKIIVTVRFWWNNEKAQPSFQKSNRYLQNANFKIASSENIQMQSKTMTDTQILNKKKRGTVGDGLRLFSTFRHFDTHHSSNKPSCNIWTQSPQE